MTAWRNWGSLVAFLAAAGTAGAQTYTLTETQTVGGCYRIELGMNLSGEMRISKDDNPESLKMTASATHVFPEKILLLDSKGLPQKTARAYENARAVIRVGAESSQRTLREQRCLIVAQRLGDRLATYCPKGLLTREEMELTSDHFDTHLLSGLLPDKAVKLQDTWKIATDLVQGLCHLDGVTGQDLTCKLEEVQNSQARVSLTGTVTGIDLGALVKLTVEGTYTFDLKAQHLARLEWKQKDDRQQGPASPASTVETTYTVKRTPIAEPACLSFVALVSVPQGTDLPAPMLQLVYQDPKSRFKLKYDRDWQMVGQTNERVVLRLLERGDFVAQATITPWTKTQPGDHLSAEAFKKAMAETPGWEQGELLQEGDISGSGTGRWIYRISAIGQMDGMKVLQNFFLIAGPHGEQVVLAVTLTQAQADKLGTRDLLLVQGIDW